MGSRLELFPLAETVRWRGKLLPRYGWYMLSGAVCDIGQFILYKTLWSSFGLPTFSWTAAYVLSIALRQEAHKVFVFGHYEGSWWRSLWRFYCVYFLTVATSMPVNWALVHLMSCLPTQLLTLGIAESTYVRARDLRASELDTMRSAIVSPSLPISIPALLVPCRPRFSSRASSRPVLTRAPPRATRRALLPVVSLPSRPILARPSTRVFSATSG